MSDEPKRSPGVTWDKKAKKYQIQLSIGQDAPQLKLGRYDNLEDANARVAPFNDKKDKLRKAGMPNKQIHEELVKLKREIGARSAYDAMPTVPYYNSASACRARCRQLTYPLVTPGLQALADGSLESDALLDVEDFLKEHPDVQQELEVELTANEGSMNSAAGPSAQVFAEQALQVRPWDIRYATSCSLDNPCPHSFSSCQLLILCLLPRILARLPLDRRTHRRKRNSPKAIPRRRRPPVEPHLRWPQLQVIVAISPSVGPSARQTRRAELLSRRVTSPCIRVCAWQESDLARRRRSSRSSPIVCAKRESFSSGIWTRTGPRKPTELSSPSSNIATSQIGCWRLIGCSKITVQGSWLNGAPRGCSTAVPLPNGWCCLKASELPLLATMHSYCSTSSHPSPCRP